MTLNILVKEKIRELLNILTIWILILSIYNLVLLTTGPNLFTQE